MALTQTQVSQLYVSVFGRASEGEGNTYWQTDQADMTATATEMLATDAAKTYFGTTLNDDQAFIEHIYKNTLGKTIADDAAGITYWVSELAGGKSKADVIVELINAAQDAANAGASQDQFNNKVEVSNYTANTLAKFTTTAEFEAYIDGVDATAASVTAAKVEVDADVPGVVGSTFTLTSGTDRGADFVGTADNDSYDAPIVQNSFAGGVSNSLSSADKLDGGAGVDTLHAELVQEFFGVTGDNQIDVQPTTANIEKATFEARDIGDGDAGNANFSVTVDAKKMTDIDEIGSKFSDGDLVIENLTTLESNGTIRNTEDITITMDHTDNFNSDRDASDLTVYFDEDYLLSGQAKTTSQANYWLLDEDSQDYTNAPLLNIERDGVTLTIDGVAVEIKMDTAVAAAADSWTAFAAALQDRITAMIAEGNTALEGLTVKVDTTKNDQTYNDFGNLVTIPAISVIDSQGRTLVPTGFTSPEEATGAFDIYGRFDQEAATVSNNPITVNVELEKVGRDGEGGDLIIGGKDQNLNGDTDVDQADGIKVFNVAVLGDDSKPSNLGTIRSTNNELATVNITSPTSTDVADLTVREMLGGGQELTLINATGFNGDFRLAENNAQQVVTANFGAGNDFMNWTSVEADGVSSGKAYSLSMGSGNDTLNANLDGDSVDTIGESFSVVTGAGNDIVNLTMDNTDGVSQQTMAVLDNLSIDTSNGTDTVNLDAYGNFDINTGDDSDFVRINSVDANGNATMGAWTFGDATGPQGFARVLYQAKMTVSFAGFEQTVDIETDAAGNFIASQMDINTAIKKAISDNVELSKLLTVTDGTGNQAITVRSTVGGENTLAIAVYQPHIAEATVTPVAGEVSLVDAEMTALAQGLINTGVVANSNDVDITAEVITEMNAISGSIDQNGNGDAVTYADTTHDVAESAPDGGVDIFDTAGAGNLYQAYNNGGSSDSTTGINFSTINLGNGANDLVVLHSRDDSVNVIKIDAEFGKASVVNFHDVSTDQVDSATEVGNHALDFSTFLADLQDESDNSPNAQSQRAIETTVNNVTGARAFADSAAGSNNAAANSVNIIRFDASVDADDTFGELTASTLVAALNDAADDGTTNFGNLNGNLLTPILDADLVGSNESHIIMVENDQNEGEYKVFSVTSTWDTVAGDTTSVSVTNSDDQFDTTAKLLGTVDFGASVNLNVVNAQVDTNGDGVLDTAWNTYVKTFTAAADGEVIEPVNNVPVIADQTLTVDENSAAGTVVGQVVATDADNDTLAYSLTDTNFAIDAATGSITVADGAALDFETLATYALNVTVNDGKADASATVTVNLNDVDETVNNAPVIADQTLTVDENSAAGTVVGQVVATDADSDTLAYSLTDTNFVIDAATGSITVADGAALDFETLATYALNVTVNDGTVDASATVTVNLNDVDETGAVAVAVDADGTYTATAATETFTVANAASYEYSITGFELGVDVIDMPDGTTMDNTALDGAARLEWASDGVIVGVTLLGLTDAQDTQLATLAGMGDSVI